MPGEFDNLTESIMRVAKATPASDAGATAPAPAPAPASASAPALTTTPAPTTPAPVTLKAAELPAALQVAKAPAPAPVPTTAPAPVPPQASNKEMNFAALRAKAEAAELEVKTLKERLAKTYDEQGQLILPDDVKKQIEERDQRITKMEEELGRDNVLRSPKFQREYLAPINATFDKMQTAIKQFEGNEKLAERLVGMSIKERYQTLTQELPEAVSVVLPMLSQLDDQLRTRDVALQEFQKTATALKQTEMVQQQEQIRSLQTAARDKVLAKMEAEGHFMFRALPGNQDWNAKVDQFKGAVNTLIQCNDIELQTEALALAVTAPVYRALYEEAQAEVARLTQELQGRRGAVPQIPLGGSGGVSMSGGQQGPITAAGLAAAAAAKLNF
jgi:hypothetical protein